MSQIPGTQNQAINKEVIVPGTLESMTSQIPTSQTQDNHKEIIAPKTLEVMAPPTLGSQAKDKCMETQSLEPESPEVDPSSIIILESGSTTGDDNSTFIAPTRRRRHGKRWKNSSSISEKEDKASQKIHKQDDGISEEKPEPEHSQSTTIGITKNPYPIAEKLDEIKKQIEEMEPQLNISYQDLNRFVLEAQGKKDIDHIIEKYGLSSEQFTEAINTVYFLIKDKNARIPLAKLVKKIARPI